MAPAYPLNLASFTPIPKEPVFFAQTTSGVTGLFRRMLGVVQVSWSSSVLLGLVAACLIAAAELRNAAAYTGFAIGGLILTAFLLITAVDTLKDSVRTLNATVTTATGLAITRPFTLAGEAATAAIGIGAAAATGGATTALTAAAAMRQTGSGRYAAAAVAGRIRPVAQLGEVAAAMGLLQDDEVVDGLYAGQRATRGAWRGTRLQMAADGRRPDAQGLTHRERAQERGLSRELNRVPRPTIVQEVGDLVERGQAAVSYLGSDQLPDAMQRVAAWLPERTRAGWERIQRGWQAWRTDVDDASGGSDQPLRRGIAVVQTLDDRLRPGRRHAVMTLNTRRQITYADPPEELPDDALVAPRRQVRIPRLLMLGYAVQERDNDQVVFWRHAEPAAQQPAGRARSSAPADDEQRRLIQAGALIGGAAAARARSSQPPAPASSTNVSNTTATEVAGAPVTPGSPQAAPAPVAPAADPPSEVATTAPAEGIDAVRRDLAGIAAQLDELQAQQAAPQPAPVAPVPAAQPPATAERRAAQSPATGARHDPAGAPAASPPVSAPAGAPRATGADRTGDPGAARPVDAPADHPDAPPEQANE